ncbi:MAG TPA: hypothetical protein VGO07_00525 [Candidatus Saccharimonadales bacterium]|jgi:phosphoglycerol transferase MdoB-like AlkP superfamily enzyme|nr:hypothetical protein [Candidatus Saccharimonadales bacterium]
MSNDVKFWVWRTVMVALLFVDFSLLFKTIGEIMNPAGHVALWATIFFVSVAGSIYVGFLYTVAKNKRWESAYQKYPEVEALDAYTKQLAREKRAQLHHNK